MFTQAQLQTLKAAVAADTTANDAMRAGDDATVAAFLNEAHPSNAQVWRDALPKPMRAYFVWSEVHALDANVKASLQLLMAEGGIDPRNANDRAALNAIFTDALAPNTRAAMIADGRRAATRAEIALGGTQVAGAYVANWLGEVTVADASIVRTV